MAKKALKIGGLSFSTKAAAAEHFRAMLYRYGVGARISEPDTTELGWLLERNSEFRDKLGAGHFSLRNALYGRRYFDILRQNGSNTDFSFHSCLDGKARSARSEALTALRAGRGRRYFAEGARMV